MVVFRFGTEGADPDRTLLVDGTEPGFRDLSHWPGNTTPGPLKRDLSTGIALAWAGLDEARTTELIGPFDVVANNHYDTDGVLSAFTVMRPGEALPRREALLAAAATGDFATWNGPDALAVDLTVMTVLHHAASPLAERLRAGLSDAARWELGYHWLVETLPGLLDDPFRHESLWAARHRRVEDDVRRVEAGDGVDVERHPDLDLAIVTTTRDLTAIGLHHAAGPLYRVLAVREAPDGPRYRLVFRDESWFDLVTVRPAPRVPLEPLARRLQEREDAEGPDRGVAWWATSTAVPVARLGHGRTGRPPEGFFDDLELTGEPASRLSREAVLEVLMPALGEAPRGHG